MKVSLTLIVPDNPQCPQCGEDVEIRGENFEINLGECISCGEPLVLSPDDSGLQWGEGGVQ